MVENDSNLAILSALVALSVRERETLGEPHRHTYDKIYYWRQFDNSNISLTDRKENYRWIIGDQHTQRTEPSGFKLPPYGWKLKCPEIQREVGTHWHGGAPRQMDRYHEIFLSWAPSRHHSLLGNGSILPHVNLRDILCYGDNHVWQLSRVCNGSWFWLLAINGGGFVHLNGQECGHVIFSSNVFSVG